VQPSSTREALAPSVKYLSPIIRLIDELVFSFQTTSKNFQNMTIREQFNLKYDLQIIIGVPPWAIVDVGNRYNYLRPQKIFLPDFQISAPIFENRDPTIGLHNVEIASQNV